MRAITRALTVPVSTIAGACPQLDERTVALVTRARKARGGSAMTVEQFRVFQARRRGGFRAAATRRSAVMQAAGVVSA